MKCPFCMSLHVIPVYGKIRPARPDSDDEIYVCLDCDEEFEQADAG